MTFEEIMKHEVNASLLHAIFNLKGQKIGDNVPLKEGWDCLVEDLTEDTMTILCRKGQDSFRIVV